MNGNIAVEEQNVQTLTAARNQDAGETDEEGGGALEQNKNTLTLAELLLWEIGLFVLWLVFGGWIPIWGGVINGFLILIIYIWWKAKGLKPPSISPARITGGAAVGAASGTAKAGAAATKTALNATQPEIGGALKAAGVGRKAEEKTGEIVQKLPGGDTILFIISALTGTLGVIPIPNVLFLSIYLANKE